MATVAEWVVTSEIDDKYKFGLLIAGAGMVAWDAYYNPMSYRELLDLRDEGDRPLRAGASAAASSYSNLADPYNTDCCICLDDFVPDDQVVQTPCKHAFHHACIRGRNLRSCPNCQRELHPPLN